MVLVDKIEKSQGWQLVDSVVLNKPFASLMPPVYASTDTTDFIKINFKGNRLGLVDIIGPSSGQIVVSIDNAPPRFLQAQTPQTTNKPDRVNWFQDLGFGMFIHWNVDGTLGAVISHSLAGASDEYSEKYFSELPQYFNPENFNPTSWAKLAKLAGMKYVHPQHYPMNNVGLMEYDKKQLKELFTNYGKIDILFIDGPGDGLREYAWSLNTDLVIT
eukprot:gene44351-59171_t